jgi:hypothetical protein
MDDTNCGPGTPILQCAWPPRAREATSATASPQRRSTRGAFHDRPTDLRANSVLEMGGGMRGVLIRIAWALAVAEAICVEPILAQVEELQNDGWSSGQGAAFQGGFATEEIGAVRLVPTIACPCQVEKVSLLFGGATSTKMVSIQFWDDPGSSNDPGAPIGLPFDVSLTGANDVLHEVTLGDDAVVNGPFRVGIEFFHDGLPSIARDSDGTITSDRNFVCANLGAECVWFPSSTLGVTGDWVIRATIVPEPGQTGLLAGLVLIAVLARARAR